MEWKASIAKRTRSLRFMGLLRQRAHCSDPALAQMQVREGLRDTPPLFPAAAVAVAGIRNSLPLPFRLSRCSPTKWIYCFGGPFLPW